MTQKPRLRFKDGRFAPFGGKRKSGAKGKTKRSYNSKTTLSGTGVEQIRNKVRRATGQTKRELAYGFIMNQQGIKVAVRGKLKGDARRNLQQKYELNAAYAVMQRDKKLIEARAKSSADDAQKKVADNNNYFKFEYEDGVKRKRVSVAAGFTTKQKVAVASVVPILGLIATVAQRRKERSKDK